jgi:hypothetical protein
MSLALERNDRKDSDSDLATQENDSFSKVTLAAFSRYSSFENIITFPEWDCNIFIIFEK